MLWLLRCFLYLTFSFRIICYMLNVYMCFAVTCWERADLLALVCGVYCEFVTFPCGILGQVWYLIVSIPDLCTYFFHSLSLDVWTCSLAPILLLAHLSHWLMVSYCDGWIPSCVVNNCLKGLLLLNYWLDFGQTW